MSKYCVIDIGGTNFRCGIYSKGTVENIRKYSTPNFTNFSSLGDIQKRLIEMICDAYYEIMEQCDSGIIGVSFPGPINAQGEALASSVIFGEALNSPYALRNKVMMELAKKGAKVDVMVVNDVTASAWRYSDRDLDPFCIITVSSGIGSKVFADGKISLDQRGLSGEIGHYGANLSDVLIPCTCGWGYNHVGMIASGRGVEYFARLFSQEDGRYRALFMTSALATTIGGASKRLDIRNEIIALCADQGDLFSRVVIDYCTRPLAQCICLLSLAISLKHVIIIGGFAVNCSYYIESLKNNVTKIGIYNLSNTDIGNMIIMGEKDDDHALIGLGKMIEKA